MAGFRFVFMADSQLGCYASFSGLDADQVAALAAQDIHVRQVPATDDLDWDVRHFEQAVALANDLAPTFVVMGGDMVNDPVDEDQYAAVVKVAEGLDAPMHWVAGNHDIALDTNVPDAASMAAYRARFGPDHYTVVHEDTTVVVVDTVVWANAEAVPDEWATQRTWLEATLATARDRGGPIIVAGHHPLFLDHADEPDSFWVVPPDRRREVLDLFHAHGVRTYLCGHRHRNELAREGRLEVVVTGAVGLPLGDDPSGLRVSHRWLSLPD
jgi:3',5'-cyclic AMP phosphodiesterase CpdA